MTIKEYFSQHYAGKKLLLPDTREEAIKRGEFNPHAAKEILEAFRFLLKASKKGSPVVIELSRWDDTDRFVTFFLEKEKGQFRIRFYSQRGRDDSLERKLKLTNISQRTSREILEASILYLSRAIQHGEKWAAKSPLNKEI